jgi:hypothetical protein
MSLPESYVLTGTNKPAVSRDAGGGHTARVSTSRAERNIRGLREAGQLEIGEAGPALCGARFASCGEFGV